MDVLEDLEDALEDELGGSQIPMVKRAISRLGTIGNQFDNERDRYGNVVDGGTVHYKK